MFGGHFILLIKVPGNLPTVVWAPNISLTPTESWAISQVPPSSSATLVQAVEVHSRKCPLKERGFNLTRLTSYKVEHTLEEKKNNIYIA